MPKYSQKLNHFRKHLKRVGSDLSKGDLLKMEF